MANLTLKANEPLSEQGLYAREFVDDLTNNHEGYTHTISAVGGFDSASFTLKGDKDYLDDWFADGIFRRIELINPEGIQVWEGYVKRLRYVVGGLVKTKSIDNMYNRIYIRYSPLDTSVSPPVAGAPQDFVINDPASQLKYGIKTAIISGGERADNTIYDWGRTVLKERKEIQVGEQLNTAGSDSLSMEVECEGYWHVLKWIPYIANKTGRIQAHQVIQEIIEFYNETNQGWFPLDFGLFDYNFKREKRGYSNLQSCYEIINEIISHGGLGGERWVGGFYQNRVFNYKEAEDIFGIYSEESDLYRFLSDPRQEIYDSATGTIIKPWDMVPDRILQTVDETTSDKMYIEQVTYREPYALQLVGGDDQRLTIYLKQRGLPGL